MINIGNGIGQICGSVTAGEKRLAENGVNAKTVVEDQRREIKLCEIIARSNGHFSRKYQ